ncbi:hypothetical protein [Actinoplanes sp. NPDC020271]|uniref:hypothetical protein n=1 Tax=Actinoplanes sp. NPDC020271 TaxID=3363896 RepID=UPI00379CD409
MSETGLVPTDDISFPVFDIESKGPDPSAWGGWVEADGSLFAVSRVRRVAPGGDELTESPPEVTVWSFAPDRMSSEKVEPALQAVLVFARELAESDGVPMRESASRLMALISSGGTAVTVMVDGSPAPGELFDIRGLGWLVSSVLPTHALAATFFQCPAVLKFTRLAVVDEKDR